MSVGEEKIQFHYVQKKKKFEMRAEPSRNLQG
jgi:hypothetical protein